MFLGEPWLFWVTGAILAVPILAGFISLFLNPYAPGERRDEDDET